VQSREGVDTDLPTDWEGKFFRSPALKALWLFLQPVFYALRPFYVNPLPISGLEAVNIVLQLAFDALVYVTLGPKMLFYLVGGSILSMGLHPMAGHVIAEHFLWTDKVTETFSYFGPLNLIAWNVGYHMAHHDFPAIPGSLLPQVRVHARCDTLTRLNPALVV
jgi:sphingolipid delta-4 desaturase